MSTPMHGDPQIKHLNPPTRCDLCGNHIGNTFYDFATAGGPWANGCQSCFDMNDGKLGTGRGQKFVKNERDGHYYKVEG